MTSSITTVIAVVLGTPLAYMLARSRSRGRAWLELILPVVVQGLYCRASQLVYPIVSDIPVLLIDEALPAAVLNP